MPTPTSRKSYVVPDAVDLRDRLYSPTLRSLPSKLNAPPASIAAVPIKQQGQTNACTGFALSSLVERVLVGSQLANWGQTKADPALGYLSPFMLYAYARRYDDIPGDPELDTGSTARAGMKAWHKHGAASVARWKGIKPPRDQAWVGDAFRRPLGAYYRVDHQCLPDIHAALNETGVLYATAAIHDGWDLVGKDGRISCNESLTLTGGHAFLLVGYDQDGFWIQNSWGTGWGRGGFAHLLYADWNRHGWDLWVAQAGVQTSVFLDTLPTGLSLKKAAARPGQKRLLSSNDSIRAQQLTPFIINLGNDGALSHTGTYGSTPRDFDLLASHYLPSALADWGIDPQDPTVPIDLAIYAHGGLTPEKSAAATAAKWIPDLYRKKIFPLFIMWETGAIDTLGDILADNISPVLQRLGLAGGRGFREIAQDFIDDRLESAVGGLGTAFWDQMKQNAAAASERRDGGLRALYAAFKRASQAAKPEVVNLLDRLRLHLIGHSAGACFHAHLLPVLLNGGLRVDGIYFMAPALRMDEFAERILPAYQARKVSCYTQFHLGLQAELDDTCGPYQKSLLWLVSDAFERSVRTPAPIPGQPLRGCPILGMEVFRDTRPQAPAGVAQWDWLIADSTRPTGKSSGATTHGGFGTEPLTMASILARISARK